MAETRDQGGKSDDDKVAEVPPSLATKRARVQTSPAMPEPSATITPTPERRLSVEDDPPRNDDASASNLRKAQTAPELGEEPDADPTRGAAKSRVSGSSKQKAQRPRAPSRFLTFGAGPMDFIRHPTQLNEALMAHDLDGTADIDDMSDLDSSDSEDEMTAGDSEVQDLGADSPRKGSESRSPKDNTQSRKKRKTRIAKHLTSLSHFNIGNEFFRTKGCVSKRDGRLKISVHEAEQRGYLAKALGRGVSRQMPRPFRSGQDSPARTGKPAGKDYLDQEALKEPSNIPRLNICVIVIGSRGDIQPFMKIGQILKERYGHRVRIATHPAFKDFVQKDCGLEFFSIGGNPAELMAFMVKNPGLVPSMETVIEGEIGRRRASMAEMFLGMWKACVNATDDDSGNGPHSPDSWVCDAIIANPPSFAPIHIAERLGVPLSIFFTMPYTPTSAFPHPLANIKASNVDESYTNFMSYPLVEMMTWQGLGDLINSFRDKTLAMEPVSTLWAPGRSYRLQVPHTYMWSPGLVPKPEDWGPEISVTGYVFLELASSYDPPESLTEFLDAGEPPVYIGFGSIVVDNPDKFSKMIFEAVEKAGVRALVSKGWGGFGSNETTPDNIYMLDNVPHDWLFPKVSACVIHGGAGTTAIALKCGKPTFVISFFGDQPFWGAMIGRAGAGAKSIPYKKLNADRLADGIKQCLTDDARRNAGEMAKRIEAEGDGAENAVKAFHRHLPLEGASSMRCQILTDRASVWLIRGTTVKISALAAEILIEKGKLHWNDLQLARHYEWNDYLGPGEPLTGISSAITGALSETTKGVVLVPVKIANSIQVRTAHWHKKRRHERKAAKRAAIKANGASSGQEQKSPDENSGLSNGDGSTSPPSDSSDRPQANRTITAETLASVISADPNDPLVAELARDTGSGVYRSAHALWHLPLMLSLAVTQGFHNAPRLYGDATVRRPIRITGYRSGLRAGRDEFVYGLRDGVTGLWQHPRTGWQENGMLGATKGVALGMGGFVLKGIAAMTGPLAYTLKGLHEQNQRARQPTKKVRKARIVQGQLEMVELAAKTTANSMAADEGGEHDAEKKQDIRDRVASTWDQTLESTVQQMREQKKKDWSVEQTFDYGEDAEQAQRNALLDPNAAKPQQPKLSQERSRTQTAPGLLSSPGLQSLVPPERESKPTPQTLGLDGELNGHVRQRSATDAKDFASKKAVRSSQPGIVVG